MRRFSLAMRYVLAPATLILLVEVGGAAAAPDPAAGAAPDAGVHAAEGTALDPIGRTLRVPLDHRHPERGQGSIYYELGAPFDPGKPTVLVVADGQQFYVRRGSIAGLQARLFGDDLNVAGIVGRGFAGDFVNAVVPDPARVDWAAAYTIFNAGQWVGDIDAVRRDLLGDDGEALLYGGSGGGFLLHQYLATHGRFIRRAFSQCAVMRPIEADLGINHDHFWEEIGRQGGDLQRRLLDALKSRPERRPEIVRILQRQNFFVAPDGLAAARAAAIDAIARDDTTVLRRYREQYQVDAIAELLESPQGVPVRVRIYESVQPIVGRLSLFPDVIYPNIENEALVADPLLRIHAAGGIPAPEFDLARLRDLDTEMFILAGQRDHTVDYRSQIALAQTYSNATLFIADDDHMFARLGAAGLHDSLARTFLRYGPRSREMRRVLEDAAPLRWIEKD
jgi:hypothetical protein